MSQIEKINAELEKINAYLDKLEESLATTDECVVDVYTLEERVEDRLDRLEEELTAVKVDNVDLKNDLNTTIKELNVITTLINRKYGDLIEKTCELDE